MTARETIILNRKRNRMCREMNERFQRLQNHIEMVPGTDILAIPVVMGIATFVVVVSIIESVCALESMEKT